MVAKQVFAVYGGIRHDMYVITVILAKVLFLMFIFWHVSNIR